MTIEEMEKEDDRVARHDAKHRKLFATEEQLAALGIGLDDLIELIEERRDGRY